MMKYKRLRLLSILLASLWLLSACGPMTIMDASTRSYIPIEGWILELHRDVAIPSGRTRVFFQAGRVLYAADEYQPHCQLTVRNLSDQPQTIHADRFVIERVFGKLGETVSSDSVRLAAASATPVLIADGGNGNGEGPQIYTYHMKLNSEDQPHVTYLVCGGAADFPALADYPTLQDIHTSLGNLAGLVLPVDN